MDVKTLKFKTVKSFGNNGAMLTTSFLNFTLIKISGHFSHENLSKVYSFQATLCNHRILGDVEREDRLEMS